MNKRQFKDKVYSELARITKSMANPLRMEIIELLAQGEFSVEQIAEQTNLPIANASQHLQVLKNAQLVEINRQGNFIFYRLSNSNV
ncbi:MAG: metalloregulator ArsR/SmtB family transcription factor, partial [Cyclobacteriaceae bacterium]|nr:metalloregulator ArsR/SmtB family transcription factor [Cyclobacteriaceae bacterium]